MANDPIRAPILKVVPDITLSESRSARRYMLFRLPNARLQPRRLIPSRAADGCKPMLGGTS
jgi:hypothetical protein